MDWCIVSLVKQAKKKKKTHFENVDVTSECFAFIFAKYVLSIYKI